MGLRDRLVCYRRGHDCHFGRLSLQYGMVGIHLSRRYVPSPFLLSITSRRECKMKADRGDLRTGVFDLLTITIGEELESKFFKILSCVSLSVLLPQSSRSTSNATFPISHASHNRY